MSQIKVKADQKGDSVVIKMLMKHPMETGQRKDKNGEKIPAHYITEVTVKSQDKLIMTANFGPAISENPYLSLMATGPKKGDTLTISWVDNKGDKASENVVV